MSTHPNLRSECLGCMGCWWLAECLKGAGCIRCRSSHSNSGPQSRGSYPLLLSPNLFREWRKKVRIWICPKESPLKRTAIQKLTICREDGKLQRCQASLRIIYLKQGTLRQSIRKKQRSVTQRRLWVRPSIRSHEWRSNSGRKRRGRNKEKDAQDMWRDLFTLGTLFFLSKAGF